MSVSLSIGLFFGVYPAPLIEVTGASVDNLIAQYEAALDSGPPPIDAPVP